MKLEACSPQANSLALDSASSASSVAANQEPPAPSGRTTPTFATRMMRHENIIGTAAGERTVSNSELACTGLRDSLYSSANDSSRFAVIVPVSTEVLESLSDDSDVDSDSATKDPNSQAASAPRPGRVMALLSDAIGLFRPRTEKPERSQKNIANSPVISGTFENGVDSFRSVASAGEALYESQLQLDPEYLSRTTKDAQRVELDDCIDICLMPNRTGTRGPGAGMLAKSSGSDDILRLIESSTEVMAPDAGRAAALNKTASGGLMSHQMRLEPVDSEGKIDNCFMCHPDAGQVVIMDREFRVRSASTSGPDREAGVMMTLNKKPYTENEHILVFPTIHLPQTYNADLFAYSLGLLEDARHGNQLIDKKNTGDVHNYTVLFAGPVGGSQSHHHQHLINKKTNLQSYIEANPQAVKRLVFADNPSNGVFRITSDALKTMDGDKVFTDPKRGELRFFDCLMVKGDAEYVKEHTTKLINHFDERQENGSVRARYNMAMLPMDDEGNHRSIIFPRSTAQGTDHVSRPILWGEKTFPPSAHEMCGHWFMTELPVNKTDSSEAEFNYNVRRAVYKAAQDVRAPIDTLALDELYQDEVTLVPSAGVALDPSHSTPDFPAATWSGWDALAVDGEKRNPTTSTDSPLRACIEKPQNLRRDTDFIKPEMSQAKVNELYETLSFVATLFKKFDIPYFGGAGTSLSAVRHGGQMPNDDDADLFLPFTTAARFESEEVQQYIYDQGYRVDTYSELDSEKGTDLVYQIRKNDGRAIKDTPFVDIAFMQAGTLNDKPVWEFSVGRKDGSRSYYRLPEGGFAPENMREIAFGKRLNEKGDVAFSGVPIMVPNEENVMFHLDGAYGKNWYQTNFVPGVGPLYISDRGHIPYKGDKLA